jgi:site-specific recombinase XerD
MLRYACEHALVNKEHAIRTLQAYLGHRSIQQTIRYAELLPMRFNDF